MTDFSVPGSADPVTRRPELDVRWYARENDLIGGWCVMPENQPPSKGIPEVADITSREVAEHIAELHNRALGSSRSAQDSRPAISNEGMRAAMDAAFPGLPAGMSLGEAERRVRAGLEAYEACRSQDDGSPYPMPTGFITTTKPTARWWR